MAKPLDLMTNEDFWFIQLVGTEPFTVNMWPLVDDFGNNVFLVFSNEGDARRYVIDAGLAGKCEEASAPPIPLLKFLVSAEKAAFYVLDHKHGQKIVTQEFHEFIWRLMGLVYMQGKDSTTSSPPSDWGISHVVFEAIKEIEKLQRKKPEAYDEHRDEINEVVGVMRKMVTTGRTGTGLGDYF